MKALILISLIILAPGLGAAMAFDRNGAIAIPTRLALVWASGYVIAAAIAYVLVLVHALRAWTFFGLLALVTVALWFVALRSVGPIERWRRLVRDARAEPWIIVGFVIVAAVAV